MYCSGMLIVLRLREVVNHSRVILDVTVGEGAEEI